MAIVTDAERLAVIDYWDEYMGGMPLGGGTIGQGEAQVFLGQYPGIPWGEIIGGLASRRQSKYIAAIID